MSDLAIFMVGVFASTLCLIFLIVTILELRRVGRRAEAIEVGSSYREVDST